MQVNRVIISPSVFLMENCIGGLVVGLIHQLAFLLAFV